MTDRRQRQREQREEKRRLELRQERIRRAWQRALRFGILLVVVVGVFFLIQQLSTREPSLPEAYQMFRTLPVACGAEAPPEETVQEFEAPADQALTGPVTATIVTSCGTMVVDLDPELAPQGVNSFVFLAEEGFYDSTVFHRIIGSFVAQGGDQQADGQGNAGYTLPNEAPPEGFVYEPGVMALANALGPNTTGSQFFFVVGPDAEALTPAFSVLGRVLEGQDVLDRIAAVPVQPAPNGERSLPREAVYVESVEIDRGE